MNLVDILIIGIVAIFVCGMILLFAKLSDILEIVSNWRYRRGKGSKKDGVSKHEKELGLGEADMSSSLVTNDYYCPNCGNEIEAKADFCSNCGERHAGTDIESSETNGDSSKPSFSPIPPQETGAVKAKRKKGKYVAALVILGVVLTVVVTSIIIWSGDNKKNAYATKAKELIASRSELLGEERDATIAFEEGRKQVDTYTDPTLMRTGYSGLADKYIPIFQGYYDRTKSIKDELALMEPPSEFQQFHDLYLKSCDSFCKAFTSIMDSFRLLQNINESTGSQMNSISVTIDRYSNEGTDLTQQAQQAWPQ